VRKLKKQAVRSSNPSIHSLAVADFTLRSQAEMNLLSGAN